MHAAQAIPSFPVGTDALCFHALCLPLILLAAQVPVWILRFCFRCQIVHGDDASATLGPLRISHLLVATAVTAVALALARVALWQSREALLGQDSMVALACAVLVIMLISTIVVLPTVLAALYSRRWKMTLGITVAVVSAIIVGVVTLSPVRVGGRIWWDQVLVAIVFPESFLLALSAPLVMARQLGYRLRFGRS